MPNSNVVTPGVMLPEGRLMCDSNDSVLGNGLLAQVIQTA
jgi:hypothetical protein